MTNYGKSYEPGIIMSHRHYTIKKRVMSSLPYFIIVVQSPGSFIDANEPIGFWRVNFYVSVYVECYTG